MAEEDVSVKTFEVRTAGLENVKREAKEFRTIMYDLSYVLSMGMTLMTQMNLSKDTNEAVRRVQRLVMIANMARVTLMMLRMEMGDPIAFMQFMISLGSTASAAMNELGSYM